MEFSVQQIIDREKFVKLASLGVDTSQWWYRDILEANTTLLPAVFTDSGDGITELFVCKTANLFSLPRAVRGYMCQGYYHDIDAVSAHPTILIHLFNICGVPPPPVLIKWAHDRASLITELFPGYPEDDAKEWLLKFLNTERYHDDCPRDLKILHHAIYNQKDGILTRVKELLPMVNFEITVDDRVRGKKRALAFSNPKGKQFSRALRHFTKRVLISAVAFCTGIGLSVDLLCHDGFMIRTAPELPDGFCEMISQHVKREVDGLQIQFKIKPHDLSLLSPDHLPIEPTVKRPRVRSIVTRFKLDPIRVHKLCAYYMTNNESMIGQSNYLVVDTNRAQVYEYIASAQAGAEMSISYKVPDDGGRFKSNPYLNLGTMPTKVRSYLVDGYFHDVDMVSSGAVIISYLLRRHGIEVPYILKLWCEDKQGAMAALMTEDKRAMDRVTMSDSPPSERRLLPVYEAIYKSSLLEKLGFTSKCRLDNVAGKFMALKVQEVERGALMAAVRSLKGVAALCHDGFLISVSEVNDGFLNGCIKRVRSIYPLLDVKFIIKPPKHDLSWKMLVDMQ